MTRGAAEAIWRAPSIRIAGSCFLVMPRALTTTSAPSTAAVTLPWPGLAWPGLAEEVRAEAQNPRRPRPG